MYLSRVLLVATFCVAPVFGQEVPPESESSYRVFAQNVSTTIAEVGDRVYVRITRADGRSTVWVYGGVSPTPPTPGPTPIPPPTPPDPDTPSRFGLKEKAKQYLSRVHPGGEKYQKALSDNFLGIGSAIAAGGVVTIDEAKRQVSDANRRTFGSEGEALWRPWLYGIGFAVDTLRDENKIQTVRDYGQALTEIGQGLQ